MRPALQRLLSRPSSLELLRYVVGPAPEFCPWATKLPISISRSYRRHNSALPAAIEEPVHVESKETKNTGWDPPAPIPFLNQKALRELNTEDDLLRQRYPTLDYGPWKDSSWTRDEIEFESDLDEKGPRLLDDPSNRADLRLWACLFDYRRRIHRAAGVHMFLDAAKRGDFQVPVEGDYARLFWGEFVKLGLQDGEVNSVVELANRTLESTGERWPQLYTTLVQSMLLSNRGRDALDLHNRLYELHTPSPEEFAKMACYVSIRQGDMIALRAIYKASSHRNLYAMVVPFLCEVEDFHSAYQWHKLFATYGDLPVSSKTAEPLVHFLSIYYRKRAIEVTRSLVDAGVQFASSVSSISDEKTTISRELINIMHGETFNTKPQGYNDDVGARWFATRWVSIDVAMTAVAALGLEEIGPVSLQAIALRERDAEGITHRLNQLRDLKIGIGNSVYSKSIAKFARSGEQEFLDCLLASDHHPDVLEDQKFLEKLLVSYKMANDDLRYRMTMAMRLIRSEHPEDDGSNIMLRQFAQTGDTTALLESLRMMNRAGKRVTGPTVRAVLTHILRPRRVGHRPVVSHARKGDDLMTAINILRDLMQSGSFVPATYWGEIIKRLGMTGRWQDLRNLCLFLASWYGPANRDAVATFSGKRAYRYRIPAQVSTAHLLHPLKILFPTSLQRSIVEWGFIHALRPRIPKSDWSSSKALARSGSDAPPVTCGIELLKELHGYHVHIDPKSVRKAILDRLIIYYGPGESKVTANRRARESNTLSLEEVVGQVNEAMGVRMLHAPDVRDTIEQRGNRRLDKAEKMAKLEARGMQYPKGPGKRFRPSYYW